MRIGVNIAGDQRVHGNAESRGIQNGDDKDAPCPKGLESRKPGSIFEEKFRGGQGYIVKPIAAPLKGAQTVSRGIDFECPRKLIELLTSHSDAGSANTHTGQSVSRPETLRRLPNLKTQGPSVSTSPALPNHATATVIGARKRGLAYGPQDDGDVGSGISGLIQN
jgi:hypothetical protein